MRSLPLFALAAVLEIAGCFAFWSWRHGTRDAWVLPLGVLSLVLFAACLAQSDAAHAGRAYAAYGGIYIAFSLLWLRIVEGVVPDRWDLTGSLVCVVGALIVLFGPRT